MRPPGPLLGRQHGQRVVATAGQPLSRRSIGRSDQGRRGIYRQQFAGNITGRQDALFFGYAKICAVATTSISTAGIFSTAGCSTIIPRTGTAPMAPASTPMDASRTRYLRGIGSSDILRSEVSIERSSCPSPIQPAPVSAKNPDYSNPVCDVRDQSYCSRFLWRGKRWLERCWRWMSASRDCPK